MSDFSTLALEADSRGLEKGVDALDRVVESGQKAADAADKVADKFKSTGAAANQTAAPVKRATDAITGNAGAAKRATDDLTRMAGATERARGANGRMAPVTKRATDELTGMGRASNRVTDYLRRMTDGIRGGANRALTSFAALAGSVLGRLTALAAAFFSLRAAVNSVDGWSDMQSRLGAATGDMEAAPEMMQRMVDIANASYSPLAQTVEVYGRNVAVLRDLGKTADEAANFTEALNHALVITATKGQDAEVVQNALSRAISTGGMRAMEYETIMSRSPRVLQAIADEAGTTLTGLRALAAEGRITGDVIASALTNSLVDLRAEAALMPATIGDAFVRIGTNLSALIGRLDQTFSASENFAASLIGVADRIGVLATADFESWAASAGDALTFLSQVILVVAATRLPMLITSLGLTAGSFSLAGAASLVFNARIAAGFVAMRTGAAAAALYAGALRGLAAAKALAGGPLGILAGAVAGLGMVLWNVMGRAQDARDALDRLRSAQDALSEAASRYYEQMTAEAMAHMVRRAQLAVDALGDSLGATIVTGSGFMSIFRNDVDGVRQFFDTTNDSARHFLHLLEEMRNAQGIEAQIEALRQVEAEFDRLSGGVLGMNAAQLELYEGLQGVLENLKDVHTAQSEAADAAASGVTALTAAQQAALTQSQELLRTLERRIELAEVEARWGRDSIAHQITTLNHEREIFAARLATMEVTQDVRDALMQAWEQAQRAEGATQGWDAMMRQLAESTWENFRAMEALRNAEPGEGWLTTAIGRIRTMATAFREAAEAASSIPGMSVDDAGNPTALNRGQRPGRRPVDWMPGDGRSRAGSGGGGTSRAAKELEELVQAAERWRQKVNEARPATERFNRAMAELVAHLRSGRLSAEEYQGAVAILVDEFANAHPAINSIADAIGQFVASGMRDFRSLLDAFKNMIREMIAMAIANPIRIALTTAFMGGGGMAQAAGGAMGGIGGGGGILGSLLGSFGSGGSIFGLGGLGGGAGLLGGLGNAISGGFMNMFNVFGNAAAAGGGLLATLGAAIPVIGLVALAFTALLGKTKLLDSGIQVTVDGMDVLVETFRTTQKEYLFGLIKSSPKTATEAMDEKDAAPLIKAVRDMQEAIIEAADILGFGADVFEDFAHVLKISTKDMNEDQAMRAVMEAIEELGDEFAGMVPGLEDFVRGGEGAMAALTRMAASLTAVQHMVDTLGHAFDEVGLIGGDVASSLVDAFGGLEAMAEATQVYWRAFYTEQERLETMTRQAADALHELGVEMPRSRDEYRALVESLDLTDESTHELYAALLRMAGVMDAILPTVSALTQELMQLQGLVQTGLDGAIRAAQDAAQANARAAADWYRASRSIREWIDRTRGSGSAMASPLQARAANEALYQTTMASAMAGDLEAAGRMTGIADQLMASVRETARSRSDAAVAEARILSDMQLLAGVGDIEGARHDVVAGLLGEQVNVLAEARDYIAAGNALTEDMIDALQSELRALDDAIEAAQLISYQYLKERLEVTVDILADADVPEYLRTLLGNAERGVTGYIDFILRSDLPPDLRWLALSGASEHVKTVEYIAEHGRMPDELMDLALSSAETMVMTVDFMAGRLLPRDLQQLALTDASELLKSITFLAESLPDDVRRVVFNDIEAMDKVLNFRVGRQVSGTVQRLALDEAQEFQRILNVVAGQITSDRVQDLALSNPQKFQRTLDIVAGALPYGRIQALALDSADAFRRVLDFQLGRTPEASVWRLALETTDQLQKTINMVVGSRLDDDTRRIALAGNSELSRTVNAVLAADINDQARRLALGNVGAYNVVVQAALAPTVSDAVRRIVVSQQGSYAAMITAAVDTRMPANERRILLQQQGGYITNIGAVLDREMPGPLRELVLNANTQAARAVTILATTPNLTDVTRTALMAQSGRIDRLIHNAITTGSLNADQRLTLQTVSERVTRTVTGVVNDDRLTSQQRSLLTAITGGSDGRLTLGGSFVFDPSTGFRTWYESQTRNSVQGPMDALRTAITPLRTALTDLRAAIGAETARARTETERLRQEAAMRELHAYIDRNLVTNSAGSHLVTDEQTNAMARILGISGGGAAKRQAIAAATDVISNLRRDADGSQQERIRQRLANERTPIEELIEAIFDPRRREVPGFATGGMHLGGLRIVGENGPELEATGPARIYSNSQTKAMLGGGNAEVVAELRALRAENAAMRQELAEVKVWTRKTAESTTSTDKTMRKFDTIGIADREDD